MFKLYDLDYSLALSRCMKEFIQDFAKNLNISVQDVIDNFMPYIVKIKYHKVLQNEYNFKDSFLIFLPKSIMYFEPRLYAYYVNTIIKYLQINANTGVYKIHTIKPKPEAYYFTRSTPNDEIIFKEFHNMIFYFKSYDKRYPNIRSYI